MGRAGAVSEKEWRIYRSAIEALRRADVRFLLGGGFAFAGYTGRWRNTKDMDFYIVMKDREKAVDALTDAGFKDYFSNAAYDRNWIYRSIRSKTIVDVIWAMANQRAQVDETWFDRAAEAKLRDEVLPIVALEEFIWCKLYIMQRDHCDWTDVFNLLHTCGWHVDWDHLFRRLEDDWPLMEAAISVYSWLCPGGAKNLPKTLHRRLGTDRPRVRQNRKRNRIRLLDSRDWFAGVVPPEKLLQV